MNKKNLNRESLDEYLVHLKIERDLAENSIISYQRDIEKYIQFLETEQIFDWNSIVRYDIVLSMQKLKEEGVSDNSIIRMTSSLRQYHQYLRQERITDQDPMQYVETPKKAEILPKVLSIEEVDKQEQV